MKSALLLLLALPSLLFAQTEYAYETFRDTRIVNGHSAEVNTKGELKFLISHRFGALNTGAYNAFGLDQASMRISLDYGVSDRFTIGLGRSTFEKTVDGLLKYKLFYQKEGAENFPFTITYLNSTTYRVLNFAEDLPFPTSARLAYAHQILVARKFNDKFAAQLMPSVLHLNLVNKAEDQNTIYSIGAAARYQFTYGIALSVEYYYTPQYQNSQLLNNSLAFCFEYKTNGHVFQLHLTNSQGMTEKFFIGQTGGSWLDGNIYTGFNISRDIQLRGKSYKR